MAFMWVLWRADVRPSCLFLPTLAPDVFPLLIFDFLMYGTLIVSFDNPSGNKCEHSEGMARGQMRQENDLK